jgi:DnaJ-class molecular chaperone
MHGEAGKGSAPRQGQYSKKSRLAFAKGMDRIYGKDCSVCNGKGYHLDWDSVQYEVLKTTCIVCNGTGKEKT